MMSSANTLPPSPLSLALSLSHRHTQSERERLMNYPRLSVYRRKRQERPRSVLLMAACGLHSLLRPLLRFLLKHVWPLRVLAVLWQTGSSVAGTILLTPFFPRSLTASPPCQFHPFFDSPSGYLHFTPPSCALYGYGFHSSRCWVHTPKPTPFKRASIT